MTAAKSLAAMLPNAGIPNRPEDGYTFQPSELTAPVRLGMSPLVLVTWEDTTNIATWQDADDIRELATDGGWVCQNVGWLVHEDDACVVVAARRADDKQGHVGLAERIPKRAIISRESL